MHTAKRARNFDFLARFLCSNEYRRFEHNHACFQSLYRPFDFLKGFALIKINRVLSHIWEHKLFYISMLRFTRAGPRFPRKAYLC